MEINYKNETVNTQDECIFEEIKVLKEIITSSELVQEYSFSIDANPNKARYLDINFKLFLTIDSMEKLGNILTKNAENLKEKLRDKK